MRHVPSLLLLAACTNNAPLTGTVTDGLSGKPIAGLRVVAKGAESAPLACQAFEATTDEAGAFTIRNACVDVAYELTDARRALTLAGGTGASTAAPATLVAWWVPSREGVFLLSPDGTSEPVPPGVELADEQLPPPAGAPEGTSGTTVRYPKSVPAGVQVWDKDRWLVLAGESKHNLTALPIVDAPALGWAYAGVEVTVGADGAVVAAPRTASLDRKNAKEAEIGGMKLLHLPATALPAGRYALIDAAGAARLIDVGGPSKSAFSGDRPPPPAPAEPAPTP